MREKAKKYFISFAKRSEKEAKQCKWVTVTQVGSIHGKNSKKSRDTLKEKLAVREADVFAVYSMTMQTPIL